MQSPIEGESFKRSIGDPDAPEKETQFYSMLGQRAIYHQGWLANTLHAPLSGWSNFAHDIWELYNLKEDRSQMNNVATPHPERLEAQRSVELLRGASTPLPLDDCSALEIVSVQRPPLSKPRSRYVYYPHAAEVLELVAVIIRGRSYTLAAGYR